MSDTRTPGYGHIDRDYALRLASTPPGDDGPVWMVNLMSYRDAAVYDGEETGISGREADDRYAPLEVLAEIGAEVVFVGDVEDQLLGDSPRWDRVAIVKYPTRRSFIEMQSRPDFQAKHVHKEAGMAETIVAGCVPIADPTHGPDAPDPVDWSEVPHPPTDGDGPAMVLHLIRFDDAVDRSEMVAYQDHAALVAVPHGVQIAGWFGVEGTIVGDGREWHEARFNRFPSKAAFMAVVLDPDRLAAQADHREVAIADTYTLIIRPTVDRIEESISATT
jgi:hypothetical protein